MIVKLLVLVVLLSGYSESKTDENPASPKWGEFPNVVTLHRLNADNEILPFCSGYVIDEKLVLTAAHCVADSNGKLNITGVYVLYRKKKIGEFVSRRINTGVIHLDYNQNMPLYDIALLSINGFFPKHMNQMNMALARSNRLLEGGQSECQAIAWDIRRSKNSKEYFKIYEENNEGRVVRGEYNCNGRCNQKKIPVSTVDIYDCFDTRFGNIHNAMTYERHFCASTNYLENCERLSGAPLMCSGVLHGIFSYGKICNITTRNVGTRLSHLKIWITPAVGYLLQKKIPLTKIMREFTDVVVKDIPQVVAVITLVDGEWRPICGGGIVNRRTILTAAHCFVDIDGYVETEDILIMSYYKKFHFHQVDEHVEVAIHPKFNWETRSNDIALVKIDGEFHPDVSPVPLALYDDVRSDLKRFSDCRVFGWGFKDYKALEKSGCSKNCVLQEAKVRPFPLWRCNEIFKLIGGLQTTGSQFCTFGGIYDTCRGESGDLVYCEGKVYGIISDGLICGNTHRPIINTRIGYYKKWIIETMKKLEKDK